MILAGEGLAELHTHLGGSVASDILWSIAHEQGIALPVKDYWEFDALVTVSDPRGGARLHQLDAIYRCTELIPPSPRPAPGPRGGGPPDGPTRTCHWPERIQSPPPAVERSAHAAIGGPYRSQRI